MINGATSLLSRLRSAVSRGYQENNYAPLDLPAWDSYSARMARYELGQLLYNNLVYSSLNPAAAVMRYRLGLYKYIRGIYNPVSRDVDIMVANTYGGNLDTQAAQTGAIPIVADNPAITEAIIKLWRWSNWQQKKNLYVRFGAMLGDTFINVVDDRERGRVMLQPLNPQYVKELELDDNGKIIRIVIEYDYTERISATLSKTYTFRLEINNDEFATFRNNQPHAYYQDAVGQAVSRWPNPYGFVPVSHATHKNVGAVFGATPYHTAIGKIHELNDQASLLNDQLRRAVRPPYFISGKVKGPSQLSMDLGREEMPAIYAPEGTTATSLVSTVDAGSILQNIDALLREISRDLPELTLSEIRASSSPPSGVALNILYGDAAQRILEARSNYDAALVVAQNMAMGIGGLMNYNGFAGFSTEDYLNGNLEHYIKERPVFEDVLSKKERLDYLISIQAPERLILQELQLPPAEIEAAVVAIEAEKAAAANAFVSSNLGGGNQA